MAATGPAGEAARAPTAGRRSGADLAPGGPGDPAAAARPVAAGAGERPRAAAEDAVQQSAGIVRHGPERSEPGDPEAERVARTPVRAAGGHADAPAETASRPSPSGPAAVGSHGPGDAVAGDDGGEAAAGAAAAPEPEPAADRVTGLGRSARAAQEQTAALIQEQVRDTLETSQRLMTCGSLPAVVSLQIGAAGRTLERMVAHGWMMAGLGRDVVHAFGLRRRG